MQNSLNQAQRAVVELFHQKVRGHICERLSAVTINFHPDRLTASGQHILKVLAKDGWIRSQFETGTSNGGLSAFEGGERWKWESSAFDGIYDRAPASDRPKYGALNYQQQGAGAAPRFGSSFFKLKLSILDRTTFCYPESWLGPKAFGYANVVEHLIALATVDELDTLDRYIEAHVHGSIFLKTDVESIVLDPCFRGTDIEADAEKLGCKVEWHKGFKVQVATLNQYPDYRGPQYVELAHEIAKQGVITPEIIGNAVNRKVYNEQDLKKVWHYLAMFGDQN
jgi:hypothetical protein